MSNTLSLAPDARDQELAALRHEVTALRQQITDLETTAATHAVDRAIGYTLRTAIPESGVFVFDHDLRFVAIDAPALDAVSIDAAAMVGHTIWDLMAPDTAALLEGPYRAALRGELTRFTDAFADHVYRFVVVPVRNPAGAIIAGLSFQSDITALVTAEQRVRTLEQLVEHAPDGILIRQDDGTIVYANPALEAMTGVTPLLGTRLATLIAPEDHGQMPTIQAQITAQTAWRGRLMYQRADGTTFPGQATVFPVTEANAPTPLVGAIIRDVTHAEAAARQRRTDILAAQQAIIRELATPLIPLAPEVIAMPLVGTIDGQRAQQIMETLLDGIVTHQAEHAILDITGVKVVDTQVAQALVRIAQAAKLLGAQMLLSGMGAEIAMTLTQLGADLAGIIPVRNLQQAIAYALAQDVARTPE